MTAYLEQLTIYVGESDVWHGESKPVAGAPRTHQRKQ
ncbi:MAG: DUF190 domain-containing protein [Pseudanabaena sp. SU_2_4]|nr:DUF190 domain-containing protein [Pseudanabaena sp. SU_2_4]NKB18104.1 DUF190 domain-containing protein [Pseudanabaena sp. CRU_2_10]